jgi:hypothetical protein
MQSFARALSPMASIASASLGNDFETALLTRHVALSSAETITSLIDMIPADYRFVLKPALLGYSATATKLIAARSAVTKLKAHQAAGTFPTFIHKTPPAIQLTKEFTQDQKGVAGLAALTEATLAYCRTALSKSVTLKEEEVTLLNGQFDANVVSAALGAIIDARYESLRATSKIPTYVTSEAGGVTFEGDWQDNPATKLLYQQVRVDAVTYAYRIFNIVEARESLVTAKALDKKRLAKQADVEMADTARAGPSIQSLVDKAVNARVKTLRSFGSKVSRSSKRPTPYSSDSLSEGHLYSRQGRRYSQDYEEASDPPPLTAPQHRGQTEGQRTVSSSTRRPSYPQVERQRGERFQTHQDEGWKWQGQGWTEEVDEIAERGAVAPKDTRLASSFRYDLPHTYPDWLLTVSLPRAVQIIHLNTSLDILHASLFKNNIHCSTGVNVPLEIQHQLSVGMRFMFHSPRNSKLIRDAWVDFTERIRWRLFFAFKGDDNSLYDPDYEVPKLVKREPPRLPAYLELGLDTGRNFVLSTISKIPIEDDRSAYRSLTPNARQVRDFLVSNDLVVTNTDKNLGLAVSKRTWIVEKCQDLIDDAINYQHLHPLTAEQILDKQCTDMEQIAILCERDLPNGDQIGTFMRHRITRPKEKHAVPRFYGIPKIHKEPVKMRPIIPCHSAIQNPAAKYISKKLKPLIQAAPTIIHGSKDLAIKLSNLKLTTSRQWYICTGDVVAFYPNIPLEQCLDIVADLYETFTYGANKATTDQELKEMQIFLLCLMVGNKNLITQFLDKQYRQTRGLAMGVADSPDLANLFGYYFEKLHGVLSHPKIPFYGRYIDDCLSIVYATSETEALNIVSAIKFDGCVIEWNVSDSHQPFLDMCVYKRREDNSLQHMPYRKARNHMERIPWISHHPLDVKRGTFIGEMSRLATLSSLNSHYCDAVKSLAALYIARGYPSDLVYKWLSDHIRERWNKRLSVLNERAPDEVLVLKTVYNTAWNYFSARELGETVLGYWRDYITRADTNDYNVKYPMFSASHGGLDGVSSELCSEITTRDGPFLMPDIRKISILNRRMITSRKRTRNLFDLTSLWKKTVLSRIEDDTLAQDIPILNPYESPDTDSTSDSSDLERVFLDMALEV